MKWGLIGCGTIGERRTQYLPEGVSLAVVFDPNHERSGLVAKKHGAREATSIDDLLLENHLEAVIIAGINSSLVPNMQKALNKGCHVLVEKPAARSIAELSSIHNHYNKIIKVGFNHRFHPAYLDLLKELKAHSDDSIMFIRAQYGNGARLGFDREWRSQVDMAGGGELLDQGVHLLDLATHLVPQLKVVAGFSRTLYWDMEVDDNTWGILASPLNVTFSFHVSSSEWKNEFRFEVYTRKRKYQWLGLGRSYGPEQLYIYSMKPEMGPPELEILEYQNDDLSWQKENNNFLSAIRGEESVFGGFQEAVNCLALVEDIYKSSKQLCPEELPHPTWFI